MRAQRAMTLVETLVVVALLGLAAVLGAVGLAGASARARVEEAERTLEIAHQTARALATAGCPSTLLTRERGCVVEVRRTGDSSVAWERSLPAGLHATLGSLDGRASGGLEFDTCGRCEDYQRAILRDQTTLRRDRVSGVTGWSEPLDTEGEESR